jgi:hypothetical protein
MDVSDLARIPGEVLRAADPLGFLLAVAVLILVLVIVFAGEGRRQDALEGLRILLFRRIDRTARDSRIPVRRAGSKRGCSCQQEHEQGRFL